MISDSLHRTMLRLTGAFVVRHPAGSFEAHFDEPSQDASVGDIDIEASAPAFTARTVDVESMSKGTPLEFTDSRGRARAFFFDKHEPDGLGQSRVLLSC